jgi:hypothetical protein
MNFTWLFDFIGRASNWFFFHVMESLRYMPNVVFIVIGSVAFLIWMNRMSKYNKEAAENHTLK